MGSWDPEKFTVEDGLFGHIRFKNGASLALTTTFALNQKNTGHQLHPRLYRDRLGRGVFPLEIPRGRRDGQLYDRQYPFMEMRDWHLDLD